MSVVQEIASWAMGQPDWMSDSVRRLFTNGKLSPQDIADIAALIKATQGIEDPDSREAMPLDLSSLPIVERAGSDVSLVAIRHAENLNAIDSGQSLTFEPNGLTIVYGYNGAGKSGYGRALKRACRARDSEAIMPNVFAATFHPAPARADFVWRDGTDELTATWTDGQMAPEPLSKIAVFDWQCARVFVDEQAEVAYVPYGLDILRELATGVQDVQKLIEAEERTAKFDLGRLSPLAGGHIVGKMLASLSHKTKPPEVEELANLSIDEMDERVLLTKLLREQDPAQQAVALRRFSSRIRSVEQELATLEEPLLDEHISKLRIALEQLVAAETASKLAATALQEGGTALPGTGTEPWEVLVRSAMTFASEQAYPGHTYPGPTDAAKCVLCQQPLSYDAKARLRNFVLFLEADAQKKHAEKRKLAAELYSAVSNRKLDDFPSDRVLLEELKEVAPELVSDFNTYTAALKMRQVSVKSMAANRRIEDLPQLPTSPAKALQGLREQRLAQAAVLEQSLTPEQRKLKLARLENLDARFKLKDMLPTVLEAIAAKKREFALSESAKQCNTAAITRKNSDLYERFVTAELREALERELRELGLAEINVGLELSGQRGMRMQQLKLSAAPDFARVKPSDILSEGEQRAIALASFLAEIGLEAGRSGIVFDDPVSSLDHIRRDQIAKRLALEARSRQVIVFTHDLAFAWALREFADSSSAKHTERHVFSAGMRKGLCADSLPFEAKKLDARLNELRALAVRAEKVLQRDQDYDAYNDLVRNGYRRMRDTWELLVEDLLLGGTVKRFRRSVETKKLRYVAVEDDDVKAVFDGMTRCSNFTHEGGAEAPPPLPQPTEFLADVESLAAAVTQAQNRCKAVEQRRKAIGISA